MANKQLILEIKALTQDAVRSMGRLEKQVNKTKVTNDRMRVSTESMERSLGQLRNKLLLVTFAFGAMGAAIKKSVSEATKVQTLTRSFRNLGKEVGLSENSLQKLRDATNGTVKDTDLLIQANNALLLGIVQNEDQLAAMFDAAQRLAQVVGQDALYGIESLTTGIGRQSRLMLDNLGIIVDTKKAYVDFAEANNMTVKAMTDVDRKTAFITASMDSVNTKLRAAGDEVIDFNQQMAQLPVAFTNLQISIGTHLAPAFAATSGAIAEVVTNMAIFIATIESSTLKNLKELSENILILASAILVMRTAMVLFSQAALVFALRFAAILAAIEAISLVRRNIQVFTAALMEMRLEVAEWTYFARKGTSDVLAKLGLDGFKIGMSKGEMEKLRLEIDLIRESASEGGVTTTGVIQDLLFGTGAEPEDILADAEKFAEFVQKILDGRIDSNKELNDEKNNMKQMIGLHESAAGKLGKALKNQDDIGEAMKKIFANLLIEIVQLKIKLMIEKQITKEKNKQVAAAAAGPLGWMATAVAFVGGMFPTGGSYTNKFPSGGSFDVNKRTVLPTNPPAIVGDNASGMERIDITPLPSPNQRSSGNITININAPIVDEYVVDSIIPAIQRAQKLNL
jgi:hypothetical protein